MQPSPDCRHVLLQLKSPSSQRRPLQQFESLEQPAPSRPHVLPLLLVLPELPLVCGAHCQLGALQAPAHAFPAQSTAR